MTGHFLHTKAVKTFALCSHGTDEPGWISTLRQQIQCGWNGVPQLDTQQMQSRCCGKKFNWVHTTSIKIFQPYRLHYFSSIFKFKFLNGWHLNYRTRDRYGSLPTEHRLKVSSGFTRGFKPLTGLCDTYRERSIELTNQLEANRQKYFYHVKVTDWFDFLRVLQTYSLWNIWPHFGILHRYQDRRTALTSNRKMMSNIFQIWSAPFSY